MKSTLKNHWKTPLLATAVLFAVSISGHAQTIILQDFTSAAGASFPLNGSSPEIGPVAWVAPADGAPNGSASTNGAQATLSGFNQDYRGTLGFTLQSDTLYTLTANVTYVGPGNFDAIGFVGNTGQDILATDGSGAIGMIISGSAGNSSSYGAFGNSTNVGNAATANGLYTLTFNTSTNVMTFDVNGTSLGEYTYASLPAINGVFIGGESGETVSNLTLTAESTVVPEPSQTALMLLGLGVFLAYGRIASNRRMV